MKDWEVDWDDEPCWGKVGLGYGRHPEAVVEYLNTLEEIVRVLNTENKYNLEDIRSKCGL